MSRARPRQGEILKQRREILLLEKRVKQLTTLLDACQNTLDSINTDPTITLTAEQQAEVDDALSPDNTFEQPSI